jgi:small subunit ribosomal protein S9
VTETTEAAPPATEDAPTTAAAGAQVGQGPAASEELAAAAPRRRWPDGVPAATGRRKEAVARVRLTTGSGRWVVNGKPLEVYFPNKLHQQLVTGALSTVTPDADFDVSARVRGGGVSGQAGALRLAVARALALADPAHRPTLKRAGYLTRDARATERKKYGLKKSRKAPQYSKR